MQNHIFVITHNFCTIVFVAKCTWKTFQNGRNTKSSCLLIPFPKVNVWTYKQHDYLLCVCLLFFVQGCTEALSTTSQAMSSPSIWNINAETWLAMPSQTSCFLAIDFPSVRPPPSKSREVSLFRARALLLLSQASSGLGLLTDPALLISTETLEGLQTSDDNPRCCSRGLGNGG